MLFKKLKPVRWELRWKLEDEESFKAELHILGEKVTQTPHMSVKYLQDSLAGTAVVMICFSLKVYLLQSFCLVWFI